ncbi:uncharacterized protein DSM5745_01001 [Aspergillus mulundensis]|uniref:Uncharacterized protein n=1 Tax=Aspergillus mulundensis TaxID=1810919 RepID=A0A3D8T570_9EURO|nr:hypothetical protein DSM5745_01001 [Aspergillus mulundensis]RDW93679.1 hypothetical protein DSM5745_01001 [Aspergillus mulundensis]
MDDEFSYNRSQQRRVRPAEYSGTLGNMQANNMRDSNMQTSNIPRRMSSNMQGTTNMPGSGGHAHDMPENVWTGEQQEVRNPMLQGVNPNTRGKEKDMHDWVKED